MTKRETEETVATLPAPGQRSLIGNAPPPPVGKAADQELAWRLLRRFRRQTKDLPLSFRRFIADSLVADTVYEAEELAKENGEALL